MMIHEKRFLIGFFAVAIIGGFLPHISKAVFETPIPGVILAPILGFIIGRYWL